MVAGETDDFIPLTFTLLTFFEFDQKFIPKIFDPSSSRRQKSTIYKIKENFFRSTIRCLLFFDLSNIFLLNLQIVFISSHYSLLTFFLKNNLKNREFTNYLLDPSTYELGTFSAKINHHAKNKYYGSSIQITACLNLRRDKLQQI